MPTPKRRHSAGLSLLDVHLSFAGRGMWRSLEEFEQKASAKKALAEITKKLSSTGPNARPQACSQCEAARDCMLPTRCGAGGGEGREPAI